MKYNLCLALFYNKKYYEAFLLFQEIENNIIIKNNPFFWYRYGLTSLNIYLNLLERINQEREKELNKEKNNNDFINEEKENNISISDNNEENKENNESFEKDDLFLEFEEFEKEYINVLNSLNSNSSNNDNNEPNLKKILFPIHHSINKEYLNEIYQKNLYQKNKKGIKKEKNIMNYLIKSINCFKKSIMLYKKQPFTIKRNAKMSNDIQYIMSFYNIENKNIKRNTSSFYNFNDFNLSQISLFTLSYMNLLFCLSLNEKYTEVLLLIKVFPPNLINDANIKNKLDYFKFNAMLNLKKYKEAEEIINKNKEKKDKNSEINIDEFDCYNTNNFSIETKMEHNSYLLLSEIYLDCRLKRYQKAEKNLNKLIKIKFEKRKNIPKYYNQLMIYILSLQNKKLNIIDFLKQRWTKLQQNEKNEIQDNIKNEDDNG